MCVSLHLWHIDLQAVTGFCQNCRDSRKFCACLWLLLQSVRGVSIRFYTISILQKLSIEDSEGVSVRNVFSPFLPSFCWVCRFVQIRIVINLMSYLLLLKQRQASKPDLPWSKSSVVSQKVTVLDTVLIYRACYWKNLPAGFFLMFLQRCGISRLSLTRKNCLNSYIWTFLPNSM